MEPVPSPYIVRQCWSLQGLSGGKWEPGTLASGAKFCAAGSLWFGTLGKPREEKKTPKKQFQKCIEQSESTYMRQVYTWALCGSCAVVIQVSLTKLSSLWLLIPGHFSGR